MESRCQEYFMSIFSCGISLFQVKENFGGFTGIVYLPSKAQTPAYFTEW
jgi:hypothetical protein